MITLITGTPGAGKTAWLVNHLFIDQADHYNARPLFVHGIPELKIPHEQIKCRSPLCRICEVLPENLPYADQWQDWAPDGSLLVFDEVQNIFRPRSSSTAVPPAVARLETHRHQGIDFFIISQGPNLFDVNVRRLVGRHIHLRATSLGRYQYEFPECNDLSNFTGQDKRPYKLPAKAFQLYKSAEIHTKNKARKPVMFYVLIFAFLAFAALAYKIANKQTEPPPVAEVEKEKPPNDTLTGLTPNTFTPKPEPIDLQPRNPLKPESAPAYDGMMEVTAVPVIIGCVSTPSWCKCYMAKGVVYPTAENYCRKFVNREVFYPIRAKPKPTTPTATAAAVAPPITPPISLSKPFGTSEPPEENETENDT